MENKGETLRVESTVMFKFSLFLDFFCKKWSTWAVGELTYIVSLRTAVASKQLSFVPVAIRQLSPTSFF